LPEPYRLKVAGLAARSLENVPERIAAAVVEFIAVRLLQNPQRIGKAVYWAGSPVCTRPGCRATGSGTASTKTAAPSW
jgi:hypothetical protein